MNTRQRCTRAPSNAPPAIACINGAPFIVGGRIGGEGDLLLVDLEADRGLVLEAVDQRRVGDEGRAVPGDALVVVGEVEGVAGGEGEGEAVGDGQRRVARRAPRRGRP